MGGRLDEADFRAFTRPLVGMGLTHWWRGYGSAIFLNFGELHHSVWKNGRLSRNPIGKMSLGIEWSWRVEGPKRIWCGSWSEDSSWAKVFDKMIGATVKEVTTFGRLPEIDLELSCGVHVLSFMTERSDPEWSIFDERSEPRKWVQVKAGRLQVEESSIQLHRVMARDVCILPTAGKAQKE